MERVVVLIRRGRTAGQWRARFENYGKFISLGTFLTEEAAWAAFNDFSDESQEEIVKKKSTKRRTIDEWREISKKQIKELSAKYR